MKFKLGTVVMTNGICNAALNNYDFFCEVLKALERFKTCDWGEICKEDKNTNEDALKHDLRLFGKYLTCKGSIYIITEWDRSITTILFPDEY